MLVQITMPSGTTVTATYSCIMRDECYLDVKVYALAEDMDHSEGLCGNFNGRRDDDLLTGSGDSNEDDDETRSDASDEDSDQTRSDSSDDDDDSTRSSGSSDDVDNPEPIDFITSYMSVTCFSN